jgi:tetratricopeptide (TPR) repeat protein
MPEDEPGRGANGAAGPAEPNRALSPGQPEPQGRAEPQPGQAAEAAAEAQPPADGTPEQVVPPELLRFRIPLLGTHSLKSLAAIVVGLALVFVCVLVLATRLRRAASGRAAPASVPAASSAERPGVPAPPLPAELAALGFDDLMERAELAVAEGRPEQAAVFYREAGGREEAGLPKVLLARCRLARVLTPLGRCDEAQRICESLRAVSRPGDDLWKSAVIGSIDALGAQGDWGEFFRHVSLLHANTARYADEAALNRWLLYCRAMAMVRIYLKRSDRGALPFGVEPPPFGQAQCPTAPLVAEHIMPTSGRYGDGTLRADYRMGELYLVSEGAPVGRVLEQIVRATGLQVRYDGPSDYPISARFNTISPRQAVELILGSIGLAVQERDGALVAAPDSRWAGATMDDARRAAMWAVQEFLILYPEAAELPEAYYALAHLYMVQGQRQMALDQWDVLCRECPASLWGVYGYYMAGRTRFEMKDWRAAERDLLRVADSAVRTPLAQAAFLWAAQSQAELGKYGDAAASFRRALAYESPEPLTAEILYNIAFCLEKSGASPLEVEERYVELRTRFPGTKYARDADYRVARMALDAGQYSKAAARYEFYLSTWPPDEPRGRAACRDLAYAYLQAGENVRAALLGEVMCAAFGAEEEYWQALPWVLEACRKAGLCPEGLDLLDRSLQAAVQPQRKWYAEVQRAGLLAEMGRTDDAAGLVAQLTLQVGDPELLCQLKLVEARVNMARGNADAAIAGLGEVALNSETDETCAEALKLMGRYYEMTKQFDRALLAYGGNCPQTGEGSGP